MNAREIWMKTTDGTTLNLKADASVLRSFLLLVERGLDVRVGATVAPEPGSSPRVVVSTAKGLLCDRCESVWKSRRALGIHRAKMHGLAADGLTAELR